MAGIKHSQEEVIEALKETGGIVSQAAEKLGLSSAPSLRARIRKSPALLKVVDEIRESTKDLAEGNIIKALKDGDKEISKWYLASLGRDRGYGNKLEVDGRVVIQPAPDLSNLSAEELKQLEEIANKVTSNTGTDTG